MTIRTSTLVISSLLGCWPQTTTNLESCERDEARAVVGDGDKQRLSADVYLQRQVKLKFSRKATLKILVLLTTLLNEAHTRFQFLYIRIIVFLTKQNKIGNP